ncbi:MAG: sulfatase-like hydrolase/transferase [Sedimentisphaerales bacterium]|nr:sulfatase-like hydrolase/transferase [Sedimentisphaerales bacterium]
MKRRPNLFLFVIDAIRYDVFGLYGYPRATTPFLAEMAAEGRFFANAYTAATWTLPSHISFMTGLSTFQHTIDYNLNRTCPYPHPFVFLPHLLRPAGYRSALISEQIFLTPRLYADAARTQCVFPGFLPPDACGFNFIDSIFDYAGKKSLRVELPRVKDYEPLAQVASTKKRTHEAREHWERFDQRIRQVDRRREVWPDLASLYRQSPYFARRYQCLTEFLPAANDRAEQDPLFVMTNLHTGQLSFEPEIRKTWFQRYFRENLHIEVAREELDFFDLNDAEWLDDTVSVDAWEILHAFDLMFMDCTLRRLCEYYRQENLLTDEDVVIFATDHGLGKAETKLSFRNCHHGAFPFEWLLRMPLIVCGPGFGEKGAKVEEIVSALDIFPTLAAAAQVEIPPAYRRRLYGRPLQERLAQDDFEPIGLIEAMIYVNEQGVCLLPRGTTMQQNWPRHQRGYCLIDGRFRLICIPLARIAQLYDFVEDPLYQRPIRDAARVAPIIAGMQRQIERRQAPLAAVTSPPPAERPAAVTDGKMPVEEADKTVVASLKALGYY